MRTASNEMRVAPITKRFLSWADRDRKEADPLSNSRKVAQYGAQEFGFDVLKDIDTTNEVCRLRRPVVGKCWVIGKIEEIS